MRRGADGAAVARYKADRLIDMLQLWEGETKNALRQSHRGGVTQSRCNMACSLPGVRPHTAGEENGWGRQEIHVCTMQASLTQHSFRSDVVQEACERLALHQVSV